MEHQLCAIEHRVFVGLVSRIRVLPSSRAVASIEHTTDAGHASVNLASGHAAPHREGPSVGEVDRIVHACHFAQSGQNRHHHALSAALSSASERGFTATSLSPSLFKASATNAEWIHEPLAPHKAISGSTGPLLR